MNRSRLLVHATSLTLGLLVATSGCKKDISSGPADSNTGPVYPVTVRVLGPSGNPQGGASIELVNPPSDSSMFRGTTDSTGKGTIKSPAGAHAILVRMGSIWQATLNVIVAASAAGTDAGSVTLAQNNSLGKALVVSAGCESLEKVLLDTAIRFSAYDSTTIVQMRSEAMADSSALLTYLKKYSIVFSDCNCGDEYGYPLLARIYGRYVAQGGKMYGGHYNYYNLRLIFSPYYVVPSSYSNDSLTVVDRGLSVALGYSVAAWQGSFSWYERFTDVPPGSSTVYGVITGSPGSATSPRGVPVIVENKLGTGKYLWTLYHNQDILRDPRLVRIVRYFLYTM